VDLEPTWGAPAPPRRPFPAEWGLVPPLDERPAWIVRNIRAGEVRAHRGEYVGWLAPELRRNLSGSEALRRMETRTRNENRLRLLQVLEHTAPRSEKDSKEWGMPTAMFRPTDGRPP
jgi:hypothetical protein